MSCSNNFMLEYNRVRYTGPFPKNEEEAFDIAMGKWIFIVNYLKENHDPEETHPNIPNDGGIHSCGLCMLYMRDKNNYSNCLGCPIRQKTGRDWCKGTPYWNFWVHNSPTNTLISHVDAAKRELAFLKKLSTERKLKKRSKI